MRVAFLACAALLLASTAQAAGITHRWNCVQEVLGISLAPPEVVMLKRSDMRERFGSDGFYDRATHTVYVHAKTEPDAMAEELAHAAGLPHGAELEAVVRRCSGTTRSLKLVQPDYDGNPPEAKP